MDAVEPAKCRARKRWALPLAARQSGAQQVQAQQLKLSWRAK
jgi:hypothetical protein